jgi:16S rRNA processing protein RimM
MRVFFCQHATPQTKINAMSLPPALFPAATLPEDAVVLGRLQGAWGVKGWLKVLPYSADADVLLSSKTWFLEAPVGRFAKTFEAFAGVVSVNVTACKPHTEALVALFDGLADRDLAQALKGAQVWVSRAAFPATQSADEFYWVDLIGLRVRNREGLDLGVVHELLATGPTSVLCIHATEAGDDGKPQERLIPFVAQYIDQVDLKAGHISVDWQPDFDA